MDMVPARQGADRQPFLPVIGWCRVCFPWLSTWLSWRGNRYASHAHSYSGRAKAKRGHDAIRDPGFDLYATLEVDRRASVDVITASWKALQKKHYPRADGQGDPELSRRLNIAYESDVAVTSGQPPQ